MNTQLELHPVQATILRELLFKADAKFSELNIRDLTSDHFSFHINKLVEAGLVEKTADLKYTLSIKGKELANRLDTDTAKIERQAKIGVALVCTKIENNVTKYLVQKRLKQPYFGYYGSPTGKIRWGETVEETAKRELLEETNLQGEFKLIAVKHKMDYDTNGSILEDKYFFVFHIQNCSGILLEKFEGGENIWLTYEEIQNLENKFPDLSMALILVQSNTLQFIENKFTIDKY